MSDLKKQAEKLGIEIDGRWSDETLQQKIEEAKSAKQPFGGKGDHDGDGKAGGNVAAKKVDTKAADDDTLPTIGGQRVASSVEIREEEAGEQLPAAPFPGDAKESHRVAAELSQPVAVPEFETSDIGRGAEAAEAEEVYPVRLLNDWWDGQGIRHARGTIIEVPYNEAIRLIETRKGERADALRRG